jgi:ribose transport system substrate-binding protein
VKLWILLLALLGLGCGGPDRKTIAVIPKGTDHVFWLSIQAGALAAGRDLNAEILWSGPSRETDFSRQMQIFDSMIARRVNGVAIAAADTRALNGSLNRAASLGIPVTVFDSGVESSQYMTFVATNNGQAGEEAARTLCSLMNGKGDVAIIMHVPGSNSTMEREQRFQEFMNRECSHIRIVGWQFGMADRAKARAVAENILTAHPGLDGIFASSEASTVGTAQALKARTLNCKVKLIGFDSSEGLVQDLQDGVISALMIQDPFRIGYEAVRTLVDKLNGKTPPKRIDLTARVVTRDDVNKPDVHALLFPQFRKSLD